MKSEFNLMMGNRIRQRREYFGYTREQFAEKVDISITFLNDIEAGSKGMSISTLIKMSELLHVTTDYILLGIEEYTDNSPIVEAFKTVDKKHVESAEELLKVFLKSLDV